MRLVQVQTARSRVGLEVGFSAVARDLQLPGHKGVEMGSVACEARTLGGSGGTHPEEQQ